MKLEPYEMLAAMDALDYRLAGQILGKHFGVDGITELARTRRPMICWSSAATQCKYTVSFVYCGRGYHWYSSVGFAEGAADYGGDEIAFDIILRKDASLRWRLI